MKLTNPKNNEQLDSPFASDGEAAAALIARITAGAFNRPDFALDMEKAHRDYGNRLSGGRQFWLHKLAMQEARPVPVATHSVDLSRLTSMLQTAGTHLKRPKIVLQMADGTPVKLALAGAASRYAGSIMVSSPTFGGAYYGRVTDGAFFAGRDSSEGLQDLLTAMSNDPERTAAAYGHMTGACCFCSRTLTDERSTSVGYGPVCAARFGLQWGARRAELAAA
jgi:hypothetical protein